MARARPLTVAEQVLSFECSGTWVVAVGINYLNFRLHRAGATSNTPLAILMLIYISVFGIYTYIVFQFIIRSAYVEATTFCIEFRCSLHQYTSISLQSAHSLYRHCIYLSCLNRIPSSVFHQSLLSM